MGLDDKATQFLLAARQLGVSFERTATIGRQRLYVTPSGLAKRLSAFGITTTSDTAKHLLNEEHGYSEPFFRLLGAVHTESFDASDYEGASCALDLNHPYRQHARNHSLLSLTQAHLNTYLISPRPFEIVCKWYNSAAIWSRLQT